MRVAFVVYDRMTTLDMVGVYDPVTRLKRSEYLPDLEWDACALSREVTDDTGLGLIATRIGEPLAGYDIVIFPGGRGTRQLIHDEGFVDWVHTCEATPLKVSVCTGALLLGAAGFLKGKRATTHPDAYDLLPQYCDSLVRDRIVDEGDVITAGGVSSSIDLGLYLCEKLSGREAREAIARKMDYPYFPGRM